MIQLPDDLVIRMVSAASQEAQAWCKDALERYGSDAPTETKTAPTPKAETKPSIPKPTAQKPSQEPAAEPETQNVTAEEISLAEITKLAKQKTRDGHTEAISGLLESYNVKKLSEIDPSDYQLLKSELEGLGNG